MADALLCPLFFAIVTVASLGSGSIGAGEAATTRRYSNLIQITYDQPLASGRGGVSTRINAEAFVEALEFVHAHLGEPLNFEASLRSEMHHALAAKDGRMALDEQLTLSEFRVAWTLIRRGWPAMALADQRAFACFVLVVAFGEGVADQSVSMRRGPSALTA